MRPTVQPEEGVWTGCHFDGNVLLPLDVDDVFDLFSCTIISKVNRFIMHVSFGLILCIWKHNKTKQIDFSHFIYPVYSLRHGLSLIQSYAVKWYSHMTLLKYSWRNYIPSYWLLGEKKPSWQGNSALISPRCLCYEEMLVMPLRCSDSSRRYWKTHVTHMPPFIGSVPTKMPRRHRSISYIMRRAL